MQNLFTLPLTDPVLIFFLVLFIILLAPLVLRKLKIPAIVGLILAGAILGPNGLNILLRDSSIVLFGTVGLLYILFLAGLEIDLAEFKRNRHKSIVFGLLSFNVPFVIGFLVTYYLLDFQLLSAILLASMFGSHTLLTYPIASRLGISKNSSVNVTVGGTMITDMSALLVLAIITALTVGEINTEFWITLTVSLIVFAVIVLLIFPLIGKWFFRTFEDHITQFIFVLALVFLGAFLAKLAGVEPIIGAFLSGLALNRLIPHSSSLMNRIEFVGHSLFIPFFLISVGMLVDFKALFSSSEALLVAVVMNVVVISGKYIAALLTQKIFAFTINERNIIFSLSVPQAAATLAAVLVGFNLGLLNENVLNGTISMILISSFLGSFIMDKSARKQALIDSEDILHIDDTHTRILVPISNPETIEQLIEFAILLKEPNSYEPIYPLAVVKDDDEAKNKIVESRKMLEKAIKFASATDTKVQVLTRIDLNIANGIIRAIRELFISEMVIGWNPKTSTAQKIFGSVLDKVLKKTEIMILVTRLNFPINTINNIVIVVPENAELEIGFARWISTLKNLAKQTSAQFNVFAHANTISKLKDSFRTLKPSVEAKFNEFNNLDDFLILARYINVDDLLVVVSARKATLSYNPAFEKIPQQLSTYFEEQNFVLLFPEQNKAIDFDATYNIASSATVSNYDDNLDRSKEFDDVVKKAFKFE